MRTGWIKDNGKVYILPHQGCYSAYQIKNNKVVKEFRWKDKYGAQSNNWRK
ncbi:hypothetical protein [Clostridium sp. C2-6-12]|uniref:hypothetical protein n=1 Tax=Clostridium sp. C2-6-12 TaxID=2698832 RepID=UPI001FAC0768|nr:hypothetical protein [Clostridium sp. C2-6-12]